MWIAEMDLFSDLAKRGEAIAKGFVTNLFRGGPRKNHRPYKAQGSGIHQRFQSRPFGTHLPNAFPFQQAHACVFLSEPFRHEVCRGLEHLMRRVCVGVPAVVPPH